MACLSTDEAQYSSSASARASVRSATETPIEHGGEDVDILIGRFERGLYYEDSGPGIDPSSREQVFTLGFSTKKGEEGIGMGMASVRQIVLAHGWEISIGDAETLVGVRFEISTD